MKKPFIFEGKFGKKNWEQAARDEWDLIDDIEYIEAEEEYAEEEVYDEETVYDEAAVYVGEYAEEDAEEPYTGEQAYVETQIEYADEVCEETVYEAETPYEEEIVYAEESAYEEEIVYAEESAYEEEIVYAEESAYEEESVYAEESAYEEEAVYQEESYAEDQPQAILYTEEQEFDEIRYEENLYDGNGFRQDADYEETDYDYGYEYQEEEEKPGFFAFLGSTGIVDKLVMLGGLAVLLVVLVAAAVFLKNHMQSGEENSLIGVGTQLTTIETIGGSGLLAVSDAQKAALEAAARVEQEKEEPTQPPKEYEEEEYKIEVNVKLSMSSIEKDLKIKFINQETGKLVGNVPFTIQIVEPDGSQTLWSDDDMDGIIYKKNLEAGQYKITVNPFQNEKYKKYGIPTSQAKVQVKSKIEYNKVDVSNEVKTEAQVDVKKEDTKKNETVVESYLADTVPWVESTATLVSYTEVAKDHILDPMKMGENGQTIVAAATVAADGIGIGNNRVTLSAMASRVLSGVKGAFARLTSSVSMTTMAAPAEPIQSLAPGEGSHTVSGGDTGSAPTASPSPSPTPSPSPSPSPTPSLSPSPTPSLNPSPSPTPTPVPMVMTLDKTEAIVFAEHPATVTVSVQNLMKEAKLTAESSDTNVATVAIADKAITITGIAPGTATITVNCMAEVTVTEKKPEGGTVEKLQMFKAEPVTCVITVKANPQKDTATVLKDNQGREVYVLDGETYRVASHADYYTYSRFFVKGEAKYTGWQTLQGERFYFDASGKKVTGEQVIQGVKYQFASDGSLVTGSGTLGIDVSKWNGNIDWAAVKNSGVSYVIIRCGYRGSSQGALIKDSKFEANIQGAVNAGLKVGVYFFTQAVDKNEALEEASMVLDCVKQYKLSYPIFLDVEPSGGRADGIDAATRTEICRTFCETIQNYGYTAGIYANKTWLEEKINTADLSSSYKIWLAQYASEPSYAGRYDLWQYKATGKVDGISGDVDMNLSYLGY